ncbi:hypothetical protein KI688_011832 [Linnemannia hyalina]|uniref:Uncharacterized protein n=1 Tax=Linnemannia hyalina TaxID=64524 RepID=A0A9P7XW50_9FUNG|nr:hypothetical protein KI688_011832 [Linnemannia hyalina]
MAQAVERTSGLSWGQETGGSLEVGTMMAILLPQWLKPDNVPEPHPPNWLMDCVFRPVWTDEAKTEGRLEFIPMEERSVGHRTHSRLEENTRNGHFKAHPALRRALDNDGSFDLVDDLAERTNGIVIHKSENGTFELASTRAFRQMISSKSYRPPTPAPYHSPMITPPPPLTATFWTSLWSSFWKNKILHNARNVWWRLLINKLPSGLHLHSIIPDMVESLCRVCGIDLKKCHEIPIFIVINTIMAPVWRYHHAFVREDQAFEPRMVLAAVDLAIDQVRAQLAEKKRQSEEREPPPPSRAPLCEEC